MDNRSRLTVLSPWTFLVAASCCLAATNWAAADESADRQAQIESALKAPVLKPGVPVEEIKSFIVARIPDPPAPKDRKAWEETAARIRRDMLDQVVFRGSAAAWRDAKCDVAWLDTIDGGPGYRIRKFRYEALPGMWIPGLLYVPDKLTGKVPLCMHVNGHAPEGKAVDYKQLRSINLAKRGLLVLNLEWFGMGQLRTPGYSHYRLNQLDVCGAAGLAPFYLAMQRGLDLGLKLEHADPARVSVSGLSGGGWQTIMISSLDERVTLANPVAGYGGLRSNTLFGDLGDSEQAPVDMALVADYTHLTAMRAPRPTLLTYNASDDCCFKSGHTLEPLLAAARPTFGLFGAQDKLRSHINHVPGTHNFEQENREQLYAAIADYFYPGDKSFPRGEIDSKAELKTAEELFVPLPSDSIDFHRLAERLVTQLAPEAGWPSDKSAATAWQRDRRAQLTALLKIPRYDAEVTDRKAIAPTAGPAGTINSCNLKIGNQWTVPAVEIVPAKMGEPKTALLVADGGRASQAAECDRLAKQGYRVLTVDPLLWGESKLKTEDPDFLFPLLVATVGERALGIQAAQLAAIARQVHGQSPQQVVTLVAHGPRASMAALVAAAVEPEAIAGVDLSGSLASLKQLIDEDKTVETLPELFAFGLLKEFDIRSLVAMVAPRPVSVRDAGERHKRELAPLAAWYALLGTSFNPVP